MSEDYGSIKIEGPEENKPKKSNTKSRKRVQRKKEPTPPAEIIESTKAPKRSKKKKEKRRSSSPLTIFAIIFILMILGIGAGIYSIPYFVKKYLPSYIEEHTNFLATTDKVSFDPLHGKIVFFGLEVTSKNNTQLEPFFTSQSVSLDLVYSALLKKQLVTKSTIIDGATLTLKRGQDGSTNFGNSFNNSKNILDFKDIPQAFALNNIELSNSKFTFNDSQTKTRHEGEEISLGLPSLSNFSHSSTNPIKPYFSAKINGSLVTFAGDKNSLDNNSIICEIKDVNLAQYFNYLPAGIPFTFEQGIGNGQLEIIFNSDNSSKHIDLKLNVTVTDVLASYKEHELNIQIPEVTLSTTLTPTTSRLQVHNVLLKSPTLNAPSTFTLNNLGVLFPKSSDQLKDNSKRQQIDVDILTVNNGTIVFGPKTSNASKQLKNIEVKISKIGDKKNKLALSGKNGTSQFFWDAELSEGTASGDFSINNFNFSDLISSDSFSNAKGSGSLTGTLSVSSHNTTGFDYQLSSANISIQNATIGKWLTAKQLNIKNGLISDSSVNLGNIVIRDGFLNLQSDKLPTLFSIFTKKDTTYILQSIKYQGKGLISGTDLPQLKIAKVSLSAVDLDNPKPEGDNVDFNVTFDNKQKSEITGKGRTKLYGFSLWLSTTFENLPSKTFLPWFDNNSLFSTTDTTIKGKGVVTLPVKSFKGDLYTDKAKFGTKTSKTITWDKGSIKGIEYTAKPPSIKVSNATISSPKFNWKRKANDYAPSLQLRHFFNNVLSGGDVKTPKKVPVRIDTISIDNGAVSIEDQRNTPVVNAKFNTIKGTIKNLDTTGGVSALFNFTGNISNCPMTLEGKANFFGRGKPHEYKIVIDELHNTDFLTNINKRSSVQINSESSSATIFQEKKGKEVNTITEISLVNATSKDRSLDLVLAMMHEDEKQTKFTVLTQQTHPAKDDSFLKEIETYLNKMIIKAQTSPFLLSNDDFSDLAEKETVDFRFGKIALTGNGMETLIRLREFLTLHPYVDLKITGEASQNMDYQVLSESLEVEEQKRVDELNKQLYADWEAKRQKMLEEEGTTLDDDPFTEEDVFIPLQPKMVTVDPQALIDLANQRAILIGQVFTERLALEPERLKVVETKRLSDSMENVVRLKIIAPKRDKNFSGNNPLDDPFEDTEPTDDPFAAPTN